MVSLWPWSRDSSSTASFEKTLSLLSSKIADTQSRLDRTISRSRRIKVLWTLYLTFAYLVYAIVLVLVVGWKNIGIWEWTGMAGGPIAIYLIRTLISAYFNFRVDTLGTRLKDQQDERSKTIQKLKDATKYNSTLELLEKYGGSDATPSKMGNDDREGKGMKHDPERPQEQETGPGVNNSGRTNLPPPPTANIQRRDGIQQTPGTPQPEQNSRQPPRQTVLNMSTTAEFAPNAFNEPLHQPKQYESSLSSHHWYDRILDLLLGEDETAPKNRIALICMKCRLVNGQAPPGTKSLSEVGTWKCIACGSLNGELDEGERIIREVIDSHEHHKGTTGWDESIGASPLNNETLGIDGEIPRDRSQPPVSAASMDTKEGGEEFTRSGPKKRKGKATA